jgi:hypothetical protein
MSPVHAHAGTSAHDPAGLDRPPHIHLGYFLPLGRPGGSRAEQLPPYAGNQGKALLGGPSLPDHDADAVYLPLSVLLGWHSEPQAALVKPLAAATPARGAALPHAALAPTFAKAPAAPAGHGRSCPIYLRALALLI